MMAEGEKEKAPKKLMDVSKPGKTSPDTTARPVIVGHKPLLQQDPMVNGDGENDKPAEDKPVAVHASKVIEPPKEDKTDDKQPNPEKLAETTPEEQVEKTEESESPAEDSSLEKPSDGNESAVVDAVADQANAKKKEDKLSEEEQKKQEAIAKLIEEKTYFVPIKVASRRRKARWSLVILILLLLAVGGYLAADGGIINVPFKLPVDLIKT